MDFGVSLARTLGIIQSKSISRASLSVNSECSAEAARLAQKRGLSVGLDFSITEGAPLSDGAGDLSSETDTFWEKSRC